MTATNVKVIRLSPRLTKRIKEAQSVHHTCFIGSIGEEIAKKMLEKTIGTNIKPQIRFASAKSPIGATTDFIICKKYIVEVKTTLNPKVTLDSLLKKAKYEKFGGSLMRVYERDSKRRLGIAVAVKINVATSRAEIKYEIVKFSASTTKNAA